MKRFLLFLISFSLLPGLYAEVRVVTTLPVYAQLAAMVGGNHVRAESIGLPGQDPHFVRPKPSYALKVRKADLFVTTGLDLELWVPALLDRAGNPEVLEGGKGYVSASAGMNLLEIPSSFSRSEGCIHVYGNPHVYISPFNILIAAENIMHGLSRIDPDHAAEYETSYQHYRTRILERMFGRTLLSKVPEKELITLTEQGELYSYLKEHNLIDFMEGWSKKGYPLHGKKIITYHKAWIYFCKPFGIEVVGHVEEKVGIPPSVKHISNLTKRIRQEGIRVILTADYYDLDKVQRIAQATGCRAVIVPTQPDETYPTFEALMDGWLDRLLAAFSE